jgi:hypothetical protein
MPEQLGFQFDGGAGMPPDASKQIAEEQPRDPRLVQLEKIENGEISGTLDMQSFFADVIPNFIDVINDENKGTRDKNKLIELARKAIEEDLKRTSLH